MSNMNDLSQDLIQKEELSERPPLTEWSFVRNCCCCGPLVKIEGKRNTHYFLRHWEFNPTMPIAVCILTFYPLCCHFALVCPRSHIALAVVSSVVICFFGVMFMWSYFAAVCMDPGYLPFNWIETQRFWYSWQDQLTGLAATEEQVLWARERRNRPPGCSFSTSAGRYVIRADHICGWISNWVGKRNHKQFMLMNFWGTLYALALICFFWGQNVSFVDLDMVVMILGLMALVIEFTFGVTMASMGISALIDLKKHRTKIQRMRHEEGDARKFTFEHSMREICGNGSKCRWFIPTPAFDRNMSVGVEEEAATDASD